MKNNPMMLAVLGVAAWYVLTQRNAGASTVGNPRYGTQGALTAPGQGAYMVPPSRVVPAVAASPLQSALGFVSQLLSGSKSAPVAAVSGAAPGYALMPSSWSWGQTTLNPANVPTQLPAVSTVDPNSFQWGGPLVSSSPLTGVYSDHDGAGLADSVIGSYAPNFEQPWEVPADYSYFGVQ